MIRDFKELVKIRDEFVEKRKEIKSEFDELMTKCMSYPSEVILSKDGELYEQWKELNTKRSRLFNKMVFVDGQVSVLNHMLNYDTPLVFGKGIVNSRRSFS